jgi:hypothetical protein
MLKMERWSWGVQREKEFEDDESEDKVETHERRHCGVMMVKHDTCRKHSCQEWDMITRAQECSSKAIRIVNMPGECANGA